MEQLDHYAQSLVTDLRDIDAFEVEEWRLERIDGWGAIFVYQRSDVERNMWETTYSYLIDDLLREGAERPRGFPKTGVMDTRGLESVFYETDESFFAFDAAFSTECVEDSECGEQRFVKGVGELAWRSRVVFLEELEDELGARGVYCIEMHAWCVRRRRW